MLQNGIDMEKIINVEAVKKLINVALPHQKEYVEQNGPAAFHYLLDELESMMLLSFKQTLNGIEADKEAVERAALIIKESESLIEKSQPTE